MPTVLEYLTDSNPWWAGTVSRHGIRRDRYLPKILQYIASGEITVLTGIRRSGKTTLLYQTIEHLLGNGAAPESILFVNCDEPFVQSLTDPLETILETYRSEVYPGVHPVLVFDEIQSISGWEQTVKAWYDRKEFTILLSGSTSSLLDSALSRLIAGRYLPVQVYPLSFAEYLQFRGIVIPETKPAFLAKRHTFQKELAGYIRTGGFPAVVMLQDPSLADELLNGYFHSIVYRDIEGTHYIRNPSVMHTVIEYLMTNISVPYSYEKLAKVVSSNRITVKDYIEFAENAFLLYELRQFSYSLKSQELMQKKIYAADTGMRNAAAFSFSRDEGRLVENIVCLSLIQSGTYPYFWKGTKEVDFVRKMRDGSLAGINVCYTDEIPAREAAGLREFADTFGDAVTERYILTKNLEKEENGIIYMPVWKWLLRQDTPDIENSSYIFQQLTEPRE